jgi:hypothetical protein
MLCFSELGHFNIVLKYVAKLIETLLDTAET